MGHQISTDKQLGAIKKHSVQEKYHTNLFLKNRMTSSQFMKQLHSVCKRSSYLRYDWTELLLKQLKSGDPNRLYSEYQTTLKENCFREGKREKIFCPAKIQRQFINHFGQRAKQEAASTSERLNGVFEESKCYFMVMAWLHKMVSLSAQDQENITSPLVEGWDLSEVEQIYEILLNLAQKAYRNFKGIIAKIQIQPKADQLSPVLTRLIKKLTTSKLKFIQKEAIIAQIQTEIQLHPNDAKETMQKIRKIFGEEVIYGHLRTIKEVGHVQVSFLWNLFGEDIV